MEESPRFPEIDTLRGIAVILMVLYHAAFDLWFFYGWPIDIFHGMWWVVARLSAILFLLIAGICFALSWERTPPQQRPRKILRRFSILALSAGLVSFATWLITPVDFVKFGILHLFALSTLLLPLFAPLKSWNALPALLILLIPILKNTNTFVLPPTPYPLLVLLGSPPQTFSSLDYFPLLPWFGVLLLGSALGYFLYIHWRTHTTILNSEFLILNSVGRHSLMIYLLHQPVLLGILSLLHRMFQTRAG